MPCPEFKSLKDLLEGWLARQKEYKAKSEKLYKEGHPVECGICFGHLVAIDRCIEDLVGLIDHLGKQAHDVYEVLLSTREKYVSGGPVQGESPCDTGIVGKREEESQIFSSSSNRGD